MVLSIPEGNNDGNPVSGHTVPWPPAAAEVQLVVLLTEGPKWWPVVVDGRKTHWNQTNYYHYYIAKFVFDSYTRQLACTMWGSHVSSYVGIKMASNKVGCTLLYYLLYILIDYWCNWVYSCHIITYYVFIKLYFYIIAIIMLILLNV